MKRIFVNGGLALIIGFGLFALSINVWPHRADSTDGLLVLFFVLAPIGYVVSLISGYRKEIKYRDLKINYDLSIPCFCLLGKYELKGKEFVQVYKSKSLDYVICLCSKSSFYFFRCSKSLMTNKEFTAEIWEDVNDLVVNISKKDILKFNFRDLKRGAMGKVGDWLVNAIAGHIQGLFTNRKMVQVSMDALVEVYYKQNGIIQVLCFGVPDGLASPFSIDIFSFLPEAVGSVHEYIDDATEVLSLAEKDPVYLKRAKGMIGMFVRELTT